MKIMRTFREYITEASKLDFGTEDMYYMGTINDLKKIIKKYAPLDIKNMKTGKIVTVYSFDGDNFFGKDGKVLFDVDNDIQLRGKASIKNSKENQGN